MYDFYKNPPKTREDIREYLVSWLHEAECVPFEIEGERFIQELGFVRAFHLHCVLRSEKTNEYLWWVFSRDSSELDKIKSFPMKRFSTYNKLLDFVVEEYYTKWSNTN